MDENGRGARPGLQAERTRLAWSRTALMFGAVGALVVHLGHESVRVIGAVPGLLLLSGGIAVYVTGTLRYRELTRAGRPIPPVAAPEALRLVTALTLVCGAGGFVLAVAAAAV